MRSSLELNNPYEFDEMKISKIDPLKVSVKKSMLTQRIKEWDNSPDQSVVAVEDEAMVTVEEGKNINERSKSDTDLDTKIRNNNSSLNVDLNILQAEEEHSSNKLVKSVLKSSSSKMVIRKIKKYV